MPSPHHTHTHSHKRTTRAHPRTFLLLLPADFCFDSILYLCLYMKHERIRISAIFAADFAFNWNAHKTQGKEKQTTATHHAARNPTHYTQRRAQKLNTRRFAFRCCIKCDKKGGSVSAGAAATASHPDRDPIWAIAGIYSPISLARP